MRLTPSFGPPSRWSSSADLSPHQRVTLFTSLNPPQPKQRSLADKFFHPEAYGGQQEKANSKQTGEGNRESESHTESERPKTMQLFCGAISFDQDTLSQALSPAEHFASQRPSQFQPQSRTSSSSSAAPPLSLKNPETVANVSAKAKESRPRTAFGKLLGSHAMVTLTDREGDGERQRETAVEVERRPFEERERDTERKSRIEGVLPRETVREIDRETERPPRPRTAAPRQQSIETLLSLSAAQTARKAAPSKTQRAEIQHDPLQRTLSGERVKNTEQSAPSTESEKPAKLNAMNSFANILRRTQNPPARPLSETTPSLSDTLREELVGGGGGRRPRETQREKEKDKEKETEKRGKKRVLDDNRNDDESDAFLSESLSDWDGAHTVCRNAGATIQGLRAMCDALSAPQSPQTPQSAPQRVVAVSFLYRDFSSNHATHSARLCTPSQRCVHWNCLCDRAKRSVWLTDDALVGALLYVDDAALCETERERTRADSLPFFLPLTLSVDEPDCKYSAALAPSPSHNARSQRTQLPLRCETTLAQRWAALWALLYDPLTTKVVFHTQVALQSVLQSIADYKAFVALSVPPHKTSQDHHTAPSHNPTQNPSQTHHTTPSHNPHNVPLPVSLTACLSPSLSQTISAALNATPGPNAQFRWVFDPRLAAHLLDSDAAAEELELHTLLSHNAASQHTHPHTTQHAHTTPTHLGRIAHTLSQLSLSLRETVSLYHTQTKQLSQDALTSCLWSVESPTAALLAEMERVGVCVDERELSALCARVESALSAVEREIFSLSALRFNVCSPEQVAHVLYERMGLHNALSQRGGSESSSSTAEEVEEEEVSGSGAAHTTRAHKTHARATHSATTQPAHTTHTTTTTSSSTPSGKFPSTSEEALRKILHTHPVVQRILDHRALSQLRHTFIESVFHCLSPSHTHSDIEREIHANWNQAATRTGRLACAKPNLQNVPNEERIVRARETVRERESGGRHKGQQEGESDDITHDSMDVYVMRRVFVPHSFSSLSLSPSGSRSRGSLFLSADYSQIEMRVLAHVTQDSTLCELFSTSQGDVYRHLALRIFRKTRLEDVSSEERDRAKVICLGVIYGMGTPSVAARLGIELSAATEITKAFLNHFPQVRAWIVRVKNSAKESGLVRTLLGRIRRLPDILLAEKGSWQRRSAAERQAVNSVVQGSASDLIKCAMISTTQRLGNMWWEGERDGDRDGSPLSFPPTARLVMQIHDELIFEVPMLSRQFLNAVANTVRDAMEREVCGRLGLRVPLVVNVSVGRSWGDMCACEGDVSDELWKTLCEE